jgi:aspartate/methionine/tyrosine aminotransferase
MEIFVENSTLIKYDLSFGNAVAVRQAFLDVYHGNMIVFTSENLAKFDYPPYEGDPELTNITRKIIKRQTGHDYKHVILTNGATGGVVLALRSMAQRHFQFCTTRPAPWYLRCPQMISAAGLIHEPEYKGSSQVVLLDFPSNPLGLTTDLNRVSPHTPVILDGVYHSQVYSKLILPLPKHDVIVGSYSKLLGLNGIRIGWVATDDYYCYRDLLRLATGEYCGLSVASMEILNHVLWDFDWDRFENLAQSRLDDNRTEFVKLERFLGTKVSEIGMFYYGNVDAKVTALMEKAEIGYTSGIALGTSDKFGRLNMGQDRELIKNAVSDFLKADTIGRTKSQHKSDS